MKKFIVFQLFTVLFAIGFMPLKGHASSLSDYIWGPPNADFVQPYLYEAKIPHISRWADDDWSPQNWINSRGGSAEAVVEGFYEAGIIEDQYFEKKLWGKRMPVLKVGRPFIELSNIDKRRVVAFMDDVFGVTRSENPDLAPVIMIYMHNKQHPVGIFDVHGLQLQ